MDTTTEGRFECCEHCTGYIESGHSTPCYMCQMTEGEQ